MLCGADGAHGIQLPPGPERHAFTTALPSQGEQSSGASVYLCAGFGIKTAGSRKTSVFNPSSALKRSTRIYLCTTVIFSQKFQRLRSETIGRSGHLALRPSVAFLVLEEIVSYWCLRVKFKGVLQKGSLTSVVDKMSQRIFWQLSGTLVSPLRSW